MVLKAYYVFSPIYAIWEAADEKMDENVPIHF